MANSVVVTENDMSLCTGCMACLDACPTKAITESFTEDGFRIPIVHEDKCIRCGKCTKVCNVDKEKATFSPIVVYRMAAKSDKTRMQCSSGGIFALLSEMMIKKNGAVIGAAFCSDCKDIRHVTSDEVELKELYRSKYVQSNTIGIYKKTESILKAGRDVLFCGTPCQVRALINFLKGKSYSGGLVTVDFMCHGVPSTMQFKDFIEERERKENSPVINVTFREKDKGWRTQLIKTYHENGNIWERTSYYYYYYYMFLNNYTLRDSCYHCNEYNSHTADITLADDWGENKNDDVGTSLVFVNTAIGEKEVCRIMDKTNFFDVTRMTMAGISIYSHSGYNYRKKEQWKAIVKDGGYHKAKTSLFYKVSIIPLTKRRLREGASMIKKFVVKIMGGVSNYSFVPVSPCIILQLGCTFICPNMNLCGTTKKLLSSREQKEMCIVA